jgi:hypothetical protein
VYFKDLTEHHLEGFPDNKKFSECVDLVNSLKNSEGQMISLSKSGISVTSQLRSIFVASKQNPGELIKQYEKFKQ